MKLIAYDFVIKHRANKINFVDALFKRFDYRNVNIEITKLLSILQKKLNKIEFLSVRNTSNIHTIFATFKYNFRTQKISIENEILMNLKNEIFKSNISFNEKFEIKNVDVTQCISQQMIIFLSKQKKFFENIFMSVFEIIKTLQKKIHL